MEAKMNKTVQKITKFEIIRQLKKPSFWASALILPCVIAFCVLIGYFSNPDNVDQNPTIDENTTIAITDDAGILPEGTPYIINGDKEYGLEHLKNGDFDLYFYIPSDFLATKTAEFYHVSEGLELLNYDSNILKTILEQSAAAEVSEKDYLAISGKYEVSDIKISASGGASNPLGKIIVPAIAATIFFICMVTDGSRLMMTVVEEKENRISEMILTSVSAKHLIIGKIISMIVLGFIQILVLIIPIAIITYIFRDNPLVASVLSIIEITPQNIIINLTVLIASIFLYTGLCTMIGTLVPTARDASQFISPVVICSVLPLYFMQSFLASEPNLLVQILTYFPPSAPLAIFLRSAFGTISTLEILISLIIIATMAVIIIKFTSDLFQKNAINFTRIKLRLIRKKEGF